MIKLSDQLNAQLQESVHWIAEQTQEWFYLRILGPVYLAKPQPKARWFIVWADPRTNDVHSHDPELTSIISLPYWLTVEQRLALLNAALTW